jgi:hypothetical protein
MEQTNELLISSTIISTSALNKDNTLSNTIQADLIVPTEKQDKFILFEKNASNTVIRRSELNINCIYNFTDADVILNSADKLTTLQITHGTYKCDISSPAMVQSHNMNVCGFKFPVHKRSSQITVKGFEDVPNVPSSIILINASLVRFYEIYPTFVGHVYLYKLVNKEKSLCELTRPNNIKIALEKPLQADIAKEETPKEEENTPKEETAKEDVSNNDVSEQEVPKAEETKAPEDVSTLSYLLGFFGI